MVLFGLGIAVGYTVHKYRKEIIKSANRAAEKSKDFVLQQRENLEDIVAELKTPRTHRVLIADVRALHWARLMG